MSSNEKISVVLEFIGKECFEIRLALMKTMKDIQIGDIVKVMTDNPRSRINLPKWCRMNSHELFLSDTSGVINIYFIKRKH